MPVDEVAAVDAVFFGESATDNTQLRDFVEMAFFGADFACEERKITRPCADIGDSGFSRDNHLFQSIREGAVADRIVQDRALVFNEGHAGILYWLREMDDTNTCAIS